MDKIVVLHSKAEAEQEKRLWERMGYKVKIGTAQTESGGSVYIVRLHRKDSHVAKKGEGK